MRASGLRARALNFTDVRICATIAYRGLSTSHERRFYDALKSLADRHYRRIRIDRLDRLENVLANV